MYGDDDDDDIVIMFHCMRVLAIYIMDFKRAKYEHEERWKKNIDQ